MAKATVKVLLELPVTFGNVNVGDGTCNLGIAVDRSKLSLAQAAKTLCGKRLTGLITYEAGNDNPEQSSLVAAGGELRAAFDVKSFAVTAKKIKAGLTFSIESIDPAVLVHFAKRAGRFQVEEITGIPKKPAAATEGDDGEEDDEE